MRTDGGITDLMNTKWRGGGETAEDIAKLTSSTSFRWILDFAFWTFVLLIMLNVFLGIIVDSFSGNLFSYS